MGNCFGKPKDSRDATSTASRSYERGIHDLNTRLMHTTDLQALAQTAHYGASTTKNTHSSIHQVGPGRLLIALFEGVGSSPSAAQNFTPAVCAQAVLSSFQECSQRYSDTGDDIILRETLKMIHRHCLAHPSLARQTSHPCGASGALVLLDLHTSSCTVANIGHTQCLLARVSGSFNSKRPDARFLSTFHTTENPTERLRAVRHPLALHLPLTQPLLWQGSASSRQEECHVLTRMIGAVPQIGGKQGVEHVLEVAVSRCTLTPADGHIVLASSGFFNVLGPAAVTLRAHLYEKFAEEQRLLAAAECAVGDGRFPILTPAVKGPSTAEHLVRFALERVAVRVGVHFNRTVDAASLEQLPRVHPPVPPMNGGGNSAAAAAAAGAPASPSTPPSLCHSLEKEVSDSAIIKEDLLFEKLVRSDVHSDLACCVVTLTWPRKEASLPPSRRTSPIKSTAAAPWDGNNTAAAAAIDPTNAYLEAVARFRWAQLHFLTDFHRLHRREMILRWQETASSVLQNAKLRAKQVAERERIERSVELGAHLANTGVKGRGRAAGSAKGPSPYAYDIQAMA